MLASAQRVEAQQTAPVQADSTAPITLGQSAAPLNGPWKFQVGDSPVDPVTQMPLWAEPGYDDSRWETVDLTPGAGSVDPFTGDPRFVPGWTTRGHPGYWGYAWYRIRIPVVAVPGENLALATWGWVDDGYQLFANGVLLGSWGKFRGPGKSPVVYFTQPAMFLLPQPRTSGDVSAAGTEQVLAFRFWMGPVGLSHHPFAGGFQYAPLLGEASAITAQTQLAWLELVRQYAYNPFEAALFLLLAIVAASLVLFDRSDPVYLWVAGALMLTVLRSAAFSVALWTQLESLWTFFLIYQVFSNPLLLGGWMMVWWVWFRLRRPAWVPKAIAALTLGYMAFEAFGQDLVNEAIPHSVAVVFFWPSLAVRLVLLALLVFIVGKGIREQGREGWLVLPAVAPLALAQFESELINFHLHGSWNVFGFTFFFTDLGDLFLAASIALLLLWRLLLSVRRQRVRALDLKQAQEMQRMLIPETLLELPGFALTSAYRPALEVGGDFFQILPLQGGGTQIVLGDVSGKGLKAAMAVSLIVGTIRVLADECREPAELLRQLNRRLHGRLQGGFATCIAIRLDPDGSCSVSSAGHPAPFLNDEELGVSGALPLGLEPVGTYEETSFQLSEGDRLALYTDGLLEARNAMGELYGFKRLKSLFATKPNAQQAVDAAVAFGQDDDITVLTLTRLKPVEESTAVYSTPTLAPA
jgi:hypothetical protein